MQDDLFRSPVTIGFGSGENQEIASIGEMQAFLANWPPERYCDVYWTALRACSAARTGHLSAEQARRALVAFAKISRILVADVEVVATKAAVNKPPENQTRTGS